MPTLLIFIPSMGATVKLRLAVLSPKGLNNGSPGCSDLSRHSVAKTEA